MADPPDSPEQPRRRKRNMLKLYYGNNTATASAVTGDPLDVDCAAFKPDAYLQQVYKTLQMPQLVKKERTLEQQVKTLDSDMQTLVYENYNKFISATDTIRKMKSKVDDMEGEMENLSKNMDTIGNLSNGVTHALSNKRSRIRKLTESHLLLKKLQFLFELPARLKKCVEMNAFAEAVRYYSRAANVLEQYKDLDSFKGIYDDCTAIMADVTEKVKGFIDAPRAGMDVIMSNVQLMLILGHNVGDLCERVFGFINIQYEFDREAQNAAYEEAKAEALKNMAQEKETEKEKEKDKIGETKTRDTASSESQDEEDVDVEGKTTELEDGNDDNDNNSDDDEGNTNIQTATDADGSDNQDEGKEADEEEEEDEEASTTPILVFLRNGQIRCIQNLEDWVESYVEVFCSGGSSGSGSKEPTDTNTGASAAPSTPRAQNIAKIATQKLNAFLADLVGEQYLTACSKVFIAEMSSQTNTMTPLFVKALEILSTGLNTLDKMAPGANLTQADVETTVNMVKRLCVLKAQQLQKGFATQVELASSRSSDASADLVQVTNDLCSWVQDECVSTLQSLQPLVKDELMAKSRYFGQEFQDRGIRRGIVQSFLSMIISFSRKFVDDGISANSAKAYCRITLVLAALCLRMKDGIVKKLIIFAVKMFPGRDKGSYDDTIDDIDDANEMQITQKSHDAAESAKALLSAFVLQRGSAFGECVCYGILNSDWMTTREPTTVSGHILGALSLLEEARSMTKVLFNGDLEDMKKSSTYNEHIVSGRRNMAGASPTHSLKSNVQKLFSDKVEVFSPVVFDVHDIVQSLIKIGLKAISETCRLVSFSKTGLQQIQVDGYYLGTRLWPYLCDDDAEAMVAEMLTQINTSTSSRCGDSVPINLTVIELICDNL